MTEEFAAAFIKAQAVAAESKLQGMLLENKLRMDEGKAPAYGPVQFYQLEQEYTINWNSMWELYRQ